VIRHSCQSQRRSFDRPPWPVAVARRLGPGAADRLAALLAGRRTFL